MTLPIIDQAFTPLPSVLATVRLSSLSDRWASLMQERAVARAELALATALLAPCERAACQAHFAAHPLPNSAQQPFSGIVREASDNVLVGTIEERDLLDLEYELDKAEAAAHRRTKRGKCSRKPQPYVVPIGDDLRRDGLAVDRLLFADDYPTRLAQANARHCGTVAQWHKYTGARDLDLVCLGEPEHDSAQELLLGLWSAIWSNYVSGVVRDPAYIAMRYPAREPSAIELTTVPPALADMLTPLQCKLASLLPNCPAIEGNYSELSRRTGIWRDALPAMLDSLRFAALPWCLERLELAQDE